MTAVLLIQQVQEYSAQAAQPRQPTPHMRVVGVPQPASDHKAQPHTLVHTELCHLN